MVTDMEGPYELAKDEINFWVKSKCGNFVLGNMVARRFRPRFVGRADANLKETLMRLVGSGYKKFTFRYAVTPRDAFVNECQIFHEFGGITKLDNQLHPESPVGTHYECIDVHCERHHNEAS